jgi:hypothetical protein
MPSAVNALSAERAVEAVAAVGMSTGIRHATCLKYDGPDPETCPPLAWAGGASWPITILTNASVNGQRGARREALLKN